MDKILDTAGQKGTGKWTGITALDEGVPLTLIGEAVFSRCLSAMKSERTTAAKVFDKVPYAFEGEKPLLLKRSARPFMPPKSFPTPKGIR